MEINIFQNYGVGLFISWGINYENRKHISINVPFFTIRIFLNKPGGRYKNWYT